jgi:hypothetical protein
MSDVFSQTSLQTDAEIRDYCSTTSFHILAKSLFTTALVFDAILEKPGMCLERPKKVMQDSESIAGFWQVIHTRDLLNTEQNPARLKSRS